MAYMGTSRGEDGNQGEQNSEVRDTKAQVVPASQKGASQADVPCSCPGCFPFDF